MFFDQIESALSLWDRFKKWRNTKDAQLSETVATRFVRLFESHGVHRNQIPRFFGHGLALLDVQDDGLLISKLDEVTLEAACDLFAVRREWLDGASPQIHHEHEFYKQPEDFAEFLESLLGKNPDGALKGVLIAPDKPGWQAQALLILEESIGWVGDKQIHRYHLCNNWYYTYWKSRAYLAACVAIGWKRKVFIHGISMPAKDIERLATGKSLMGWQGEGVWQLGTKKWYPEDMALKPDAFLKDIDPERENYGIRAGLTHWLELEQSGLMDTGFNGTNARELFERELAKLNSAATRK